MQEKEDRFKFLLSKLEGEIAKFTLIKSNLDLKRKDIITETAKVGSDGVNVTLFAQDQENLNELTNSHLMELENLKNYITNELSKVQKQKELFNNLKAKYGDKVSVEDGQFGGFKIKYTDNDIEEALQNITISKKILQNLRDTTMNK